MSKKKDKRVDLDVRPQVLFQNYDYTSEGPNATSPGGGIFRGVPGGGEKSIGAWIKKRRKQNKKIKKSDILNWYCSIFKEAAK